MESLFAKEYLSNRNHEEWSRGNDMEEIELQKMQNELRIKQLKLQNWEQEFQSRQSIVTSNGIVIKKIFNA